LVTGKLGLNAQTIVGCDSAGSLSVANAQLTIKGRTATNKQLIFGRGTGDDNSFIQGWDTNVGGMPLFLNPYGGTVFLGVLSVDATGNVATAGSVTIGSGTPITKMLSATAVLDFGSIAPAGQAELTIGVTGAAAGDSVQLGRPAALAAGLIVTGRVSAAGTVTVRASNITAGAIDPASATYRATITRF
jgi:hypothetical protein